MTPVIQLSDISRANLYLDCVYKETESDFNSLLVIFVDLCTAIKPDEFLKNLDICPMQANAGP